ncbi:hypothetical protein C8R42DRAFT_597285, partial [Lentinula raphanica]
PQQTNTYDCGLFVIYFIKSHYFGHTDFSFGQSDMQYLRLKTCWEIANKTLYNS